MLGAFSASKAQKNAARLAAASRRAQVGIPGYFWSGLYVHWLYFGVPLPLIGQEVCFLSELRFQICSRQQKARALIGQTGALSLR